MTTLGFISCAKCGESLEDELPNCPMCGELLSPDIFVELEIPKPEEVVIEEQTTDHLRFRLPSRPTESKWKIGLSLIIVGVAELCALMIMSFPIIQSRYLTHTPIGYTPIFIIIIETAIWGAFGIWCCIGGVYFWIGEKTFDFRPMHLTIRTSVGRFSFQRKFQVVKIRRVNARTTDLISCRVIFRFRTIYLASGHPPETARFVTQLIRRQLKTMGHELADS